MLSVIGPAENYPSLGLGYAPLNEIVDERYTVYFPVVKAGGE